MLRKRWVTGHVPLEADFKSCHDSGTLARLGGAKLLESRMTQVRIGAL